MRLLFALILLGFSATGLTAQKAEQASDLLPDRAALSQITEQAHRYYRSITTEDLDLSEKYHGALVGLLQGQLQRIESAASAQAQESSETIRADKWAKHIKALAAIDFAGGTGSYAKARQQYAQVQWCLQDLQVEFNKASRRRVTDQ